MANSKRVPVETEMIVLELTIDEAHVVRAAMAGAAGNSNNVTEAIENIKMALGRVNIWYMNGRYFGDQLFNIVPRNGQRHGNK